MRKKTQKRTMPTRIERKAESAKKMKTNPSSASSDASSSDHDATLEIINKLSKKLLTTPREKKSGRRSSRHSKKFEPEPSSPCTAGDKKTNESNQSVSDSSNILKSIEIYDFDQSDEVRLRLDLSPIKPEEESGKKVSKPRGKALASGGKLKQKSQLFRGKQKTPPLAGKQKTSPFAGKQKTPVSVSVVKSAGSKRALPKTPCLYLHKDSSKQKKPSPGLTSLKKPEVKETTKTVIGTSNKTISPLTPSQLKASTPSESKPARKVDNLDSGKEKPERAGSRRSTRKRKADPSESAVDSGVFMTPPSLLQSSVSSPVETFTSLSTQPGRSPGKSNRHAGKDKKNLKGVTGHGFDCHLAPSPMLSPVQRVSGPGSAIQGQLLTSQSDYYNDFDVMSPEPESPTKEALFSDGEEEPLPKLKTLNISRTYGGLTGLGYYDKPVEKKKSKTGRTGKKPNRQSLGQYEHVADKLNQEFDDLDDFALSIEG